MKKKLLKLSSLSCMLMLCILCALSTSCNGNKKSSDIESITLTGTKMSLDDDFLTAFGALIVGNYFVSQPYSTDEVIYVGRITADSIKSLGSYLRKGNGPGEYLETNLTNKGDSILLVLNSAGDLPTSMTEINLDSLVAGKKVNTTKFTQTDTNGFRGVGYSYVPTDKDRLLMNSGWYEKGNIFTLFNPTTNEFTPIDWLPKDGFKGPAIVKASAYMDNSRLLSSENRVCYVSGNGKIAIIFQLEKDKLVPIKTLFEDLPDYWADSDGLNYRQRINSDELDAAATDNQIFLLNKKFNMEGKLAEGDREPRVLGNTVYVFNWEGEPICNLTLDQLVYAILVSSDGKNLYGITQNKETGEEEILRFNLPENTYNP